MLHSNNYFQTKKHTRQTVKFGLEPKVVADLQMQCFKSSSSCWIFFIGVFICL